MFGLEDAGTQGLDTVTGKNGYTRLQDDGACIQFRDNMVHGAARDGDAGLKGLLLRMQAAKIG